ncbi:MAG: hypothetical protein PHS93_08435 [Candidatus Omnitrophica bacterium]|nr:hypothetical protein [Candidatus Neomarinimicrobiota bacterium]MDD5353170.1 hypothetical protein [Candidatus Omnitrophota bacterium]
MDHEIKYNAFGIPLFCIEKTHDPSTKTGRQEKLRKGFFPITNKEKKMYKYKILSEDEQGKAYSIDHRMRFNSCAKECKRLNDNGCSAIVMKRDSVSLWISCEMCKICHDNKKNYIDGWYPVCDRYKRRRSEDDLTE